MGQKFKDIVNTPHKKMFKMAKELLNAKVTDAETEDEKSAKEVALRTGGVVALPAAFMLWLAKYVTLDNHLIRAMEKGLAKQKVGKNKKGKDKVLPAFSKKYPDLSAHMIYYMLAAALIGGLKVAEQGEEIKEQVIEWQIDHQPKFEAGTYGAYMENLSSVTPYLIVDLIAKEGVRVNANGMHVPYKDSKGIWTIGFGSTVLKDGTPVTPDTPPITNDEAYELARWHVEDNESFFILYCYDVAVDGVDVTSARQVMAMGSAMYNTYSKIIENKNDINHQKRMAALRDDFAELGYGITDDLIKQRFAEYPIVAPTSFGKQWLNGASDVAVADKFGSFMAEGGGIIWRRWLEAGLMSGQITPQMMLDCPVGGMYEFFVYKGRKKSAFWTGEGENKHVNTETFEDFRQWLKNPVNKKGQSLANWKKVRDYLPVDVLAQCEHGQCEVGVPQKKKTRKQEIQREEINTKTYVVGYDVAYASAAAAHKGGNYGDAVIQFENLVQQYPDNALLRNDLADTYNKLGRYDDAIAQAQEIVRRIGDKSQYGAAQYNAGYAYEQKGDLQKALANYKLAVANGNRSVQKDVTRVTEKINAGMRGKKVAFNAGGKKIKNAVDTRYQGVQTFYVDDFQNA